MKPLRLVALVAVAAVVAAACEYTYLPYLGRVDEPVVLTGAELPGSSGIDPASVVAYRYSPADGWAQIPTQIDQRHVVDFGVAPGSNNAAGTTGTVYGGPLSGITALQYSDPNTFVGADPNPMFDSDDELVLMARDFGVKAPAGLARPPQTQSAGIQVKTTDPLSNKQGFAYLFRSTAASPDQGAGIDHVEYTFSLDSGDYRSTYRRADGPNPEHSTVVTDAYQAGFRDRWIHDELIPLRGTGVDILDGHKSQFALNFCGRSNTTFADAEGAFVANIDGPLRAIRSYVGANSGPLTERTFLFYRDRYEIVTDLRVHGIGSVMSFVDFSSAADSMQFRTSTMNAPVTIDAVPDSVPSSLPQWAYVAGPQGVVTFTARTEMTQPGLAATQSLIYLDQANPADPECWGDGQYHGAFGVSIGGPVTNTDPRLGAFNTFRSSEVVGVWGSNTGPDLWAQIWAPRIDQPLVATAANQVRPAP